MEIRTLATGLMFPEGPIALDDGSVLLVEIARGTLSRVTADGTVEVVAELGGGPNGAAIGPDGAVYICQQRRLLRVGGPHGVHHPGRRARRVDRRVDPAGRPRHRRGHHALHRVVRAARCGPRTTSCSTPTAASGSPTTACASSAPATAPACTTRQPDGSSCEEVVFPLDAPNGIGLSPDGTVLYAAETHTGRVYSWQVTAPGAVAAHRPRSATAGTCWPACPGSRCSTAWPSTAPGWVCVGTLVNGGITCISPDGATSSTSRCPTRSSPTSASAGPTGRTAYATLSATGQLVAFDWPRPGPPPRPSPAEGRRAARTHYPWRSWPGPRTFYVETLGCPKNQVDSDKLVGTLLADGMAPADSAEGADLVVVNTCAFIEDARQESIDVVLDLAARKGDDARLVVTGCMAERYGDELAEALPEADPVAGFGVPVTLGRKGDRRPLPSFDLLNLPRPAPTAPWAYVKVAEGCDKACGFCAIPSFRGPQRSRTIESLLAEVDDLAAAGVREVVLVAQDLASFGRDQGVGERSLVPLVGEVAERVRLGPAALPVPVGPRRRARRGHLRHRRALLRPVAAARRRAARAPHAPVGRRRQVPGPHRRHPRPRARRRVPLQLHRRLPGRDRGRPRRAAGVRARRPGSTGAGSSPSPARTAPTPPTSTATVPAELMAERLAELRVLQDDITALRRDELVGEVVDVLVDAPGVARSHREAPEIDGIIAVPTSLAVGTIQPGAHHRRRRPRLRGRADHAGVGSP